MHRPSLVRAPVGLSSDLPGPSPLGKMPCHEVPHPDLLFETLAYFIGWMEILAFCSLAVTEGVRHPPEVGARQLSDRFGSVTAKSWFIYLRIAQPTQGSDFASCGLAFKYTLSSLSKAFLVLFRTLTSAFSFFSATISFVFEVYHEIFDIMRILSIDS